MYRPKRLPRRKFIQICTEQGLDKYTAENLYLRLKSKRKILLVNTPSNVDWIRASARKAALRQAKSKT
ncbi:MAG: hypothetical protein ACKKL6_01940 [Candidatus Komeilibacteria bacterium]